MEHIEEFAYKIGRLTKSKAYLDFCEEVCGYRLYLFNMLDREQLDFIIRSIPLTSSDCILDLGCGAGSILNFLADKYGCSGIGLDRLERDVFKGNRNSSVSYVKGDMDRLRDYHLHPTVALSIDSLYFSRDLNALLRDLFDLRNCRKYIFYSQYLLDESARDRSVLRGDHTSVAEILHQNSISYEAIDYSENERLLYERSLIALEKRRQDFCSEGNAELYESKLEEILLGKQLYDNGLASRFLYISG